MTRGFTRQRIKQTALKLFRDQGYDRTSLREIAEHLDVTKAAVYYHFKTKEGILAELFDEHLKPIEDVIAWAEDQLPGLSTRQEALRRYEAALAHAAPLLAILQENHRVLRDLAVGAAYRDLWTRALALFQDPEADLAGQLRSVTALVAVHAAPRVLEDATGSVEEKRRAALVVGTRPAHFRRLRPPYNLVHDVLGHRVERSAPPCCASAGARRLGCGPGLWSSQPDRSVH